MKAPLHVRKPFARASLMLAMLIVASAAAGAQPVAIDGSETYQTIEGFGTCLIGWGSFGKLYDDDFAGFYANDVGLNMLRVELSRFQHPEVENPGDISWQTIDTEPRAAVHLNFAKRLKKVNPDLRVIGTVWTPPVWLKLDRTSGNNLPGRRNSGIPAQSYKGSKNRVDPEQYEHFAQWMVALAGLFKEEGVPFYGLSIANEPRFSQWYGSCVWIAEDYAKGVAIVGKALEDAGFGDIKLFGPEDMTGHMFNHGTKAMVEAVMAHPVAREQLDVFATHGYTDGVNPDMSKNSSARFWDFIKGYNKPFWITEGGTGPHDWPAVVQDGGIAMGIHNAFVAGHASAFVPWQISEGKPSTHALAVNDRATHKTAVVMHYARTLEPDTVRIASEPGYGDVFTSAYRHPESGALSVVIVNGSDTDQNVELTLQNVGTVTVLNSYQTTQDELFQAGPTVAVRGGRAVLSVPGPGIVSLVARDIQHKQE